MSRKPIVAVILSGCGVRDGSEIHEAVMTLLAIDRHGAEARCFAPDMLQAAVVNHRTGEPMAETRNVLVESARIARGKIQDLAEFDVKDCDALILPGGFGAATNLSSFAADGADCQVQPTVQAAIRAMHAAGKPIGALCIAPVVVARALGKGELTIGDDPGTAGAIEAMGGHHRKSGHREVVIDRAQKLVTSPCYMLEADLTDIADDADLTVAALLSLAGK